MDERIADIEAKYAFQEELLRQLDEVVRNLNAEMQGLRREVEELRTQVLQANPQGGTNKIQDEVPPHY